MSLHELTLVETCRRLARGEITSRALVEALIARADAVEPSVNALVHRFDQEALARADELDAMRARGEVLGPLHGVPLTIKESMATAGTPVTLGLRARLAQPAAKDAVVVQLLRKAGAIVWAKTNISQLLLFSESANAVWGATNNPFDVTRVPGGSSGGEAAALASGTSIAGIGTDIGGSIRVPCAWSGVAGIKPTVDRWSNVGSSTALMGQEVVRGQCGPMARTSEDVAFLFRLLDSPTHAELDPAVPPLPIGDPDALDLRGLRVGVVEHDGFFTPSSSVARGVRMAADSLEGRGAKLIAFRPPDTAQIIETYLAALSSDGGVTLDKALSGEPIVPQLKMLRRVASLPNPVRKAAAQAMGLAGEQRVKLVLDAVNKKTIDVYWQLTARRTALRLAALEAWRKAEIDAVVSPAHATVAVRHGDTSDFTVAGSYSMYYNFVNFPAGVVPVTLVAAEEGPRATANDRLDRKAQEVERGSTGLPIGVQVAAKPYREDMVLALMMAIEAGARAKGDFPTTPVTPTR